MKGGTVKIILLTPRSKACDYGAIQDFGPGYDMEVYNGAIEEALEQFFELEEYAYKGESLEFRTVDYPVSFGLDAINASNRDSAVLYIRFYALRKDKPFLTLRRSDGDLYSFYEEQFWAHWNIGDYWDPWERVARNRRRASSHSSSG